jgi:hypothetical protein
MSKSFQFTETDYHFSHLICDDEIQENGAFTLLPVRRHDHYKEVDKFASEMVKTWAETVTDGTTDGFHGTDNSISGTFDSLILPEAKPERLKYSVWWTQFFVFDGIRPPQEE